MSDGSPDQPLGVLVVPFDANGPGFLADFVNRATLHGYLCRTEVLTSRDELDENGKPKKVGLRAVAW